MIFLCLLLLVFCILFYILWDLLVNGFFFAWPSSIGNTLMSACTSYCVVSTVLPMLYCLCYVVCTVLSVLYCVCCVVCTVLFVL